MAGRAARFVWRERCDAINWRMLRALDLADVVRRGDPARLEPLALHLTFARLPRTATAPMATAPGDRDTWAVVRVLQLAMEYLLFMRSRDGDVVDSLHQQLQLCEHDLDEAKTRAGKWKGQARSGERQVNKLHQVLQNIAKLLHIHGASPSAVATIETLLTELVVERRARQQGNRRQRSSNGADDTAASRAAADEAQVCGRCGKLFSSPLYLKKHVARRHSSKTELGRPAARSPTAAPVSNSSDNNSDEQGAAQALAMQSLVQKFDQMLHSHEENFRLLSAQEANRVQHLYEQFHVEARLVEELKASRLHGEQELGAQREALDTMLREKLDVSSKLDELKDEIKRLTAQHKQLVDTQAFASVSEPVAAPVVAVIPSENEASVAASDAQQQVTRLQTTLQETSQTLEETRVKLSRLQAEHLSAIREKQMLSDRLDQARDTIDRLEESAAAASQPFDAPPATLKAVSVVTKEAGTQASPAVTADSAVQTDCIVVATSAADQPKQLMRMVEETSTQTEPDLCRQSQVLCADASVQASLDDLSKISSAVGDDSVIQTIAQAADESASATTRDAETLGTDNTGVPEYIQEMSSRELVDMVMDRSERAAASTSRAKSSGTRSSQDTKPYSSVPRRSYLRSRFPHTGASVKDRIAHCLEKVDVFAGRFGVSSHNGQVLSDEHFGLVRQALHAHLEVLPTDVLDRMVQCEATVNKLIESEWVPREKTREQALERFKLETHAKSAVNQALVKQALAAFRSGSPHKARDADRQSTRERSQEEADAEANANRSKNEAGAASNGGDSESLALSDLRQEATLGGSASGGDLGAASDTFDKRDQELGGRQRDDHQHDKKNEEAGDTTQVLWSETNHIHPEPDEVPAPVSADCFATGSCRILVDPPGVADSPCEDAQAALMSNIMEQVGHAPEGTISSVGREATDGVDTPSFEDPHAIQLRDDQELVDALVDARPRANSPKTLTELCQLDSPEYADAQDDEIEITEDPIRDTSQLSAPATPILARSLEELAHSERSMSIAASSELSFAASVPSLESEDSRGDVGEVSTRDSTQLNEAFPLDPSDGASSETTAPAMDEWETIESHEADDRPVLQQPDSCASDPSDSSTRGVTAREEGLRTDIVSRSLPRPAPADDDDDIEEIELA